MFICVSQSPLLRSCHRSPKCGEKDYVMWILLKNVLNAFLEIACHWDLERSAKRECDQGIRIDLRVE